MDTSETYIKMCEKATEMQSSWEPIQGDVVHINPITGVLIIERHPYTSKLIQYQIYVGEDRFVPKNLRDNIWLPRQDQLQEMVLEKKQTTLLEPLAKLCLNFDEFIHPDNYCLHGDRESGYFNNGYCPECVVKGNLLFQQFTSMEQFWLAFVMKEKYSKTWNGDNWI